MIIDGSTPIAVAARILLGERLDEFRCRVGEMLANPGREEVHDLRVSSRRLREALQVFAPCYPPGAVDYVAAGVKKVTRALGKIRVADEAVAFFASAAGQLRGDAGRQAKRLSSRIARSRKRRIARLGGSIGRLAPPSLLERYREIIATPLARGTMPVSSFAGRAFLFPVYSIVALLPPARRVEEVETHHRLRIAFKHFRYRLELVWFLLPERFPAFHRCLKRYQDLLGEMHDLDDFAALAQKKRLPTASAMRILELISERRRSLFAEFQEMLETVPPVVLGERVISLF